MLLNFMRKVRVGWAASAPRAVARGLNRLPPKQKPVSQPARPSPRAGTHRARFLLQLGRAQSSLPRHWERAARRRRAGQPRAAHWPANNAALVGRQRGVRVPGRTCGHGFKRRYVAAPAKKEVRLRQEVRCRAPAGANPGPPRPVAAPPCIGQPGATELEQTPRPRPHRRFAYQRLKGWSPILGAGSAELFFLAAGTLLLALGVPILTAALGVKEYSARYDDAGPLAGLSNAQREAALWAAPDAGVEYSVTIRIEEAMEPPVSGAARPAPWGRCGAGGGWQHPLRDRPAPGCAHRGVCAAAAAPRRRFTSSTSWARSGKTTAATCAASTPPKCTTAATAPAPRRASPLCTRAAPRTRRRRRAAPSRPAARSRTASSTTPTRCRWTVHRWSWT